MKIRKFGRYEIEQELGRGGMAVVYLARDPYVKRRVAVKVLPHQFTFDAQIRARFQREAEVIAALEDPYTVPIYDFGEHEEQPFIVMRYMPGGSLVDRIKDGPVSVGQATRILQRISSALDAAHAQHIIHRDLKPGNILFDARGEPFLADFGIAKIVEASAVLTHSGGIVGTPAYMSPEQVYGDDDLDGRSDIYALGVLLFEMLTGQVPYQADTPARQMMKHLLEPIPRILEVKPDLPPDFQVVVEKAMAKERAERYATASHLAKALTAIAESEAMTQMPTVPETVVVLPQPEPVETVSEELVPPPQELDPHSRWPFEPEMFLIPAGEFLMGSDPKIDAYTQDNEQPQHRLYLDDYYLAKTPVTNAQYAAFVRVTEHPQPDYWQDGKPPPDQDDHPVVAIFWHDAVAYCRWLAKVTGKPYRLPSEIEWEKGARGKDGRIFPWGNRWNAQRCNSMEGGKGKITPVDTYPSGASPYGLLDMVGNVSEWTRSSYRSYPYNPVEFREDIEISGDIWPVVRGGAFNSGADGVRCAVRRGDSPYRWNYHLGFRVVISPKPQSLNP